MEQSKRVANDTLGQMNYERPLQNIIVQQIKLIDKTLSGMLTGTNINMADESQAQQLMTSAIHQASSFPVGLNAYTQNQNGTMSSRKVEKRVQKEDPLGNNLLKANGEPQMTTIFVDEPVQNAQVQFTQAPQPAPPLSDQYFNQNI